MSVLYNNDSLCLVDHEDYISKLYTNVTEFNGGESVSLRLRPSLFCIRKNKQKETSRKRRREADKIHEETMLVKEMYAKFLNELPIKIKDLMSRLDTKSDVSDVRDISKQLFESTVFDHKMLNGGNSLDTPLKCTIRNEEFLVPSNSRFYCGCVKEQCKKLKDSRFQLLVVDPPWWNKYIRRLKAANQKLGGASVTQWIPVIRKLYQAKFCSRHNLINTTTKGMRMHIVWYAFSYSMMYNEDIASIPVKDLLTPNCLVAVWCTNAPSNIASVKDLIFPKWGVEYLTTWYWLKVTTDLEPLCDFGSGSRKQPFERIIIGRVGDVMEVPTFRLIVSVPSALHSHKPPLLELLTPYLHEDKPQTLELFARYLLPNTTSVGFEPLKWQHLSLYETVS